MKVLLILLNVLAILLAFVAFALGGATGEGVMKWAIVIAASALLAVCLRPLQAVVVNDIRDIFHDEDRRARNITLALIGSIWAMYLCLAIFIAEVAGRFIPIEQRIHHIIMQKKVVKQAFVPVPSNVKYPPLDDPKKACSGAPVVIVGIDVAGSQGQSKDDNSVNTWFTVRPAGDAYTVACYMSGDYSQHWHEGDLVSLIAGKISSKDDKS